MEKTMTNEQYYLVRLPLTDGQETSIRRELLEGPILDPAHMFAHLMGIVATPIQPCADVEIVAWEVKTANCDHLFYGEKSARECEKGVDGIVEPLVRRTDMEAQIVLAYERGWLAGKRDARNQTTRVAAEKDAIIAKYREYYEASEVVPEKGMFFMGQSEFARIDRARAAISEGVSG